LRFTVHRPPRGEVSLCWHRSSGGDVACCVHVGVARPRTAGHTREHRLALAVFGCDVPANRASLRRVRSRDPFEAPRSFMVEPGNQPAPPLTADRAVEPPLLRDPNTRVFHRATRGAGHRPHIKVLHPNGVKSAGKIGGGLFHPVASPVGVAGSEFGDCQPGALSAVGAALGVCQALLQPAQPGLFTRCQAWGLQQLPGRQCRRNRHSAVDADHTAIARALDWAWNVRERDMPAPRPILSDAIRLDPCRNASAPAESNPSDLGYPHPAVAFVEFFDMTRFQSDLAEAFISAGLAKCRAAMGAREEVAHRLCEVAQRLLLHCLRPRRQPDIFGADLGQLGRLLVIARGVTAGLPKLLLLDGQVPHEPGVAAMFHQHHLLRRRWQQPEPRHIRKVDHATDNNGQCKPAYVGIGVPPWREGRGFSPKGPR
jgi:hypothetical protein